MNASSGPSGTGSNLVVAIRVRPFNQREKRNKDFSCVSIDENKISVANQRKSTASYKPSHEYRFSYVYNSVDPREADYADQERVFNDIGLPVIERAMEGFNSTIFAYGQTGSGKSYTMTGGQYFEKGLIPRIIEALFSGLDPNASYSASINVSYLEIYKERMRDLLTQDPTLNNSAADPLARSHGLKIREDKKMGVYVEGLTSSKTSSYEECMKYLERGNYMRVVAETQMNKVSSRSHAVFIMRVNVTRKSPEGRYMTTSSIVNLVDLAGSERQIKTDSSGTRLEEACSINKSLFTLGLVISGLAKVSSNPAKYGKLHIPYRDSVLTRLLQTSLGGNAHTAMVATISPANSNHDETISTLKFAMNASTIVNTVFRNESESDKIIRELREQIAVLESNLSRLNRIEGDLDRANRSKEDIEKEYESLKRMRLANEEMLNNYKGAILELLHSKNSINMKMLRWEAERRKLTSGALTFHILMKLALGSSWVRRPVLIGCNGGMHVNNFVNFIRYDALAESTVESPNENFSLRNVSKPVAETIFGSSGTCDVVMYSTENVQIAPEQFRIKIYKELRGNDDGSTISIVDEISDFSPRSPNGFERTNTNGKYLDEISVFDDMSSTKGNDMVDSTCPQKSEGVIDADIELVEPSSSPSCNDTLVKNYNSVLSPQQILARIISEEKRNGKANHPELNLSAGSFMASDKELLSLSGMNEEIDETILLPYSSLEDIRVEMEPIATSTDCVVLVNGVELVEPVSLHTADRIILLGNKGCCSDLLSSHLSDKIDILSSSTDCNYLEDSSLWFCLSFFGCPDIPSSVFLNDIDRYLVAKGFKQIASSPDLGFGTSKRLELTDAEEKRNNESKQLGKLLSSEDTIKKTASCQTMPVQGEGKGGKCCVVM